MAIEKVDVGVSDEEMFRSAMADEPTAEHEQAEPKERTRDEAGRYAPEQAKEADAAPTQQQPVEQPAALQEKDEAQVPSWRLRELREQREAAENRAREFENRSRQTEERLAALQRQWEQSQQPKPEPVDFFVNPDAAMDQRLTPFEARMEQLNNKLVLRASKAEAMAEHGVAVVKEMEQAIGKAMQEQHPDMPTLSMQMRNSDDPVSVAMNWYRRDKLIRETGGDLTGYEAKLQEKLLKDPAFQAKAMEAWRTQASQPGNPSKTQLPPSLNRASGSAGNSQDAVGDLSNESLWDAVRPAARGRK